MCHELSLLLSFVDVEFNSHRSHAGHGLMSYRINIGVIVSAVVFLRQIGVTLT